MLVFIKCTVVKSHTALMMQKNSPSFPFLSLPPLSRFLFGCLSFSLPLLYLYILSPWVINELFSLELPLSLIALSLFLTLPDCILLHWHKSKVWQNSTRSPQGNSHSVLYSFTRTPPLSGISDWDPTPDPWAPLLQMISIDKPIERESGNLNSTQTPFLCWTLMPLRRPKRWANGQICAVSYAFKLSVHYLAMGFLFFVLCSTLLVNFAHLGSLM